MYIYAICLCTKYAQMLTYTKSISANCHLNATVFFSFNTTLHYTTLHTTKNNRKQQKAKSLSRVLVKT